MIFLKYQVFYTGSLDILLHIENQNPHVIPEEVNMRESKRRTNYTSQGTSEL